MYAAYQSHQSSDGATASKKAVVLGCLVQEIR
jgi:hypothetical protein